MDISYKNIWRIAFPVLISLLLEHMINVTDTAFLGHVGKIELGASSLAGVYYMAMYMLGFGFSIGVQILISRRNGEGRYSEIGNVVSQGIGFLMILALTMSLLSYFLTPIILKSLIKSTEIYNAVITYLNWRVFGLFFSFVSISYRAFFIGITHTRTLTANAVLMVASNIVFNYILVFGKLGFPEMGIAGAAIGSSLSEFVSMMFYIIYTWRNVDGKKYNLFKKFAPKLAEFKQILKISVWTMLQSFMFTSQWFLYFAAVEHLGERSIAIATIIRSINTCFFMIIFAFADTTSSLISNMLGAGSDIKQMRSVYKRSMLLAYMIGVPFLIVIAIFPTQALSLFTNDINLINDAVSTIYVMVFSYLLSVPALMLFNTVSATGNTFRSMRIMFTTMFVYMIYVVIIVVWLKMSVAVSWTSEYIYSATLFTLSLLFLRVKSNWVKKI